MRSTFHLLETAKRSLVTQQAALNTTGHNIANANTPGFSRQIVNMSATRPIEAVGLMRSNNPGQLGTGVEVTSITRVRQQFLDDQFRNENKSLGNWSIQSDTLEKLEKIVNEPSDSGLRTVLDNFWKSWSDLANDPENVAGRKIVAESAKALTDSFNETAKKLNDLSADLTESIDAKAGEINTLTSAIASLNDEIMQIEGLGDNPNDLRDQRDLLTDQLSKIVDVQVVDTPQGYTINMGGTNLVTYKTSSPVTGSTLESAFTAGDLKGGEVYGIIVSRDQYVTNYIKQLDTLANSIANGDITITIPAGSVIPEGTTLNQVSYSGGKEVLTPKFFSGANRTLASDLTVKVKGLNGLHKLGYELGSPVQQAGDFFTAKKGFASITAESIQLNLNIDGNTNKIATSLRTTGTAPNEEVVNGNKTVALLMGQLKDTKFSFGSSSTGSILGSGTVDDFFRSVVGQLGVQSQDATRQTTNENALVDQVESLRQSVSGVSLDEEMANMIKFQRAYEAASRVVTTFDQLLDKVINGMGIVGR